MASKKLLLTHKPEEMASKELLLTHKPEEYGTIHRCYSKHADCGMHAVWFDVHDHELACATNPTC